MTEASKQILICLLAAHFLGDFILQSDADASRKRRGLTLLRHAFTVTALGYVFCGLWSLWQIPLIIFLTHGLTDYIKATLKKETAYSFILDQAVHLAVIGVIIILIVNSDIVPLHRLATLWVEWFGRGFLKFLILISGVTVALKGGGILIGLAVEPFTDQLPKSGGGINSARGFENGGKVIGYLERSLIFLLILTGQPGGIGFLIAAKSILRFGEVKDQQNRMEAEYIIIGTLMSFGYGMFIAYVTKFFLDTV